MSTFPLVRVSWLDHSEPAGPVWWELQDIIEAKPSVIESVGFLVYEDNDVLKLSTSESDDGLYGRPLIIVKSAIVSRG